MTLGDILSNYTYHFILLLFRFSGLFLITPIFSSRIIPSRIKEYEDKIVGTCDEFLSQAKAYLDLEGKK